MAEHKHTPGPWRAEINVVDGSAEIYILGEDAGDDWDGLVADIRLVGDDDLRLMAAAPQLLEALEELTGWCDNWMPDDARGQGGAESLRKAAATIAAARGKKT